jgi:glycerophosphoryl diester phosphodiesterase
MKLSIQNLIIVLLYFMFCTNNLFAQSSRIEKLNETFEYQLDYIMVTAHRSAHQHGPENSIDAIREAIRLEVDIVEIDVRETKDRKLVIVHDESIDQVTDGKGKIKELTFKELKGKRLLYKGKVTDQRVLTLNEALREMKEKVLINLDFKAESKESLIQTCQLIKKEKMEDQVLCYIYKV